MHIEQSSVFQFKYMVQDLISCVKFCKYFLAFLFKHDSSVIKIGKINANY